MSSKQLLSSIVPFVDKGGTSALVVTADNQYKDKNYHVPRCMEELQSLGLTVDLFDMPKPLRKYRKIKIMDDNGNESTMLLGKQSKVKIGYRYRFYFKETQRISLGSEYLDSAMSSDCFLGYEELGEFSTQTTE